MPNIDRHALWIATALCLARAVLGLIFFMAGVYKVFLPFVELGAGALVLLGWLRTAAYSALGSVIVVVTFGHLLHEPLYAFHEHVIPRLALLLLLLLMLPEADRFSRDELRTSRERKQLPR